jgi:thiol-disulfide isomerase/thioredoxin
MKTTQGITISVISLLAFLSGAVLLSQQPRRPLTVLQDAPEFDLKNVLGGELHSKDFKGKVVVVDFWATWCVPCKVYIPDYNVLRARLKDKGVEFLGLTFESGTAEAISPFVKELQIQYPVAVGTDAVDAGFGGTPGFPATFVVGKDWKIYRRILGSTPDKMRNLEKDIEELLARQVD